MAILEKQELVRWPRDIAQFGSLEQIIRASLLASEMASAPKLLTSSTVVATFGSCFAGNIGAALKERGIDVRRMQIPEIANTTYANRHILEWVADGPNGAVGQALEEHHGAVSRAKLRATLAETGVLIFTVGVAPNFFSKVDGSVRLALDNHTEKNLETLLETHEFRTTGVEENAANLRRIIDLVHRISPACNLFLTLSPVPLNATFEMDSAVVADCISKSILRVALHEVMKDAAPFVRYWPSFEIVRWLGPLMGAVYGVDDGNTRHIRQDLIDLIVRLFVDIYGTGELSRAAPAAPSA